MAVMAIAGMINWGYSFPADLVKTTIQCHIGPGTPKIREVFIAGYKRLGFKYFYQGISPTFALAGPLHILLMVTYEQIAKFVI